MKNTCYKDNFKLEKNWSNRKMLFLAIFCSICSTAVAQQKEPSVERDGLVTIEAESFVKQELDNLRKWHIISKDSGQKSEVNTKKIASASAGTFIQVLPDTRVVRTDKMFKGQNFSDLPGKLAVISYPVKFKNTGRYYVWVKCYSTGSEDNGVHVGLDGEWPESGRKMQWCEGKNAWTWASKQRTLENHCGEPGKIFLEVKTPGIHNLQFSMREDGFAMDQIILAKDSAFAPNGYQAPKASVKSAEVIQVLKATDFPFAGTNFYHDKPNGCLAINPNVSKDATVETAFPFETGKYSMVLKTVGENDGSSSFTVWVNNKQVLDYTPPLSTKIFQISSKYNSAPLELTVNKGDLIKVKGVIGSADGKEYSRGRWLELAFKKTNTVK